jgi:hypothetical protein
MAISTTPTATRRIELETKYGKIIRANPQMSGTTAFWFFLQEKAESDRAEEQAPPKRRLAQRPARNNQLSCRAIVALTYRTSYRRLPIIRSTALMNCCLGT